ncbi:Gfo/Idh/MocA family oxidoreductase [soil metagenome]
MRTDIGVGVVGFGWMGQAHSRSLLRAPTLFRGSAYRPRLVVCADSDPDRREQATGDFGFSEATEDWRKVVAHPDVRAVWVTAPNMLHVEVVSAAAAAGKAVFCEKPVGGTPAQTVRAEAACRAAGVRTGVGYNYRWAPLVQYAKRLISAGAIGEVVHYRGSFFSMYGADPLGLLSWRFLVEQGGHGASSDLLSHTVDLATFLVGPVARVLATTATFIADRPLPRPGAGTHYSRGAPGDPTGAVTNEDYIGALAELESGARATFEACRTFTGPESQNAFTVYGTKGGISWNLEELNELQVYLPGADLHAGWTTVHGGDRFPYHGAFAPGDANGIGFEDLIAIEDHEFCSAVADDRPFHPGFDDAVRFVSVQDALLRSAASGSWQDVIDLTER